MNILEDAIIIIKTLNGQMLHANLKLRNLLAQSIILSTRGLKVVVDFVVAFSSDHRSIAEGFPEGGAEEELGQRVASALSGSFPLHGPGSVSTGRVFHQSNLAQILPRPKGPGTKHVTIIFPFITRAILIRSKRLKYETGL